MVDLMEDTLRIVRWYLDPNNHDAVAVIAARITKQTPDRFGWLFTEQDDYRDPNLMPDRAALQVSMQLMKDMGFVRAVVDVGKHADLSLIEEAGEAAEITASPAHRTRRCRRLADLGTR